MAPHPPLQDMIIKRRSSVGGRREDPPKRLLRFMEAKLVIEGVAVLVQNIFYSYKLVIVN